MREPTPELDDYCETELECKIHCRMNPGAIKVSDKIPQQLKEGDGLATVATQGKGLPSLPLLFPP